MVIMVQNANVSWNDDSQFALLIKTREIIINMNHKHTKAPESSKCVESIKLEGE